MRTKTIAKGVVAILATCLLAGTQMTAASAAAPAVGTVNAGGGAFSAADGTGYAADHGFSGGRVTSAAKVTGTADTPLYSTLRVGMDGYSFPVENGEYDVTLKMVENYWSASGKRRFDVAIEGSTKMFNYDVFAAAGGQNRAHDRTFTTKVVDGRLDVDFKAVVDLPSVAAIQVKRRVPAVPVAGTVNAGGGVFSAADGTGYAADHGFSGGRVTSTSKVIGTADTALYSTLRVGMSGYSFPVENGEYEVTLKMIENYWSAAGKRRFDVAIEGSTKLSGYDVFAAAGAQNRAHDRSFTTKVVDGRLDVAFKARVDLASIAAIQVTRRGSMAQAPVASPTPTPVASSPVSSPTPTPVTSSPSGSVLFRSDYSVPSADTSRTGWRAEQEPRFPGAAGAVAHDRVTIVGGSAVPGAGAYKPVDGAMRVELRPYESKIGAADGDVQLSGTYKANRAEVYGRVPTYMSSTPAAQWPDPVGSVRWYAYSLYVPADFESATDTKWLSLTQWKGYKGGSPPLGIEIKRGDLRLGGTRTNQGLVPNDGSLGAIKKGQWTRLVVGVRFSTDPKVGWVEVYRDGATVVPRLPLSTMDTYNGTGDAAADPIYFKQGIYRGGDWQTTPVLYFGPTTVGTTRDAVMH